MRILFLAPHPFFQQRGTPIADRAVLEVLSARGDTVDIVCFPEGEPVDIPGCAIHRVSAIPGLRDVRPGFSLKKLAYDVQMVPRCVSMLREHRYHLIHAVEEAAFVAPTLKRRFGVPYVYDMDSCIPQQMTDRFPALTSLRFLLDRIERRAVRESAGVIAVCRALEEVAARHAPDKLIHRVEDFSLLPGDTPGRRGAGAVPGESVAKPDAELARLAAEGPVVLYVGNLEPYQGIDLLIDGFRLIEDQLPDARLGVVGGHPTDLRRYRAKLVKAGLSSRIRFVGPRPQASLASVLHYATVVVSPRLDGQNTPMKIYSYLDSNRPILATRLPPHTQVLDSDIALLVEPTPAAMAAGLVRLLTDSALRASLARAAKDRVRAEFSPDVYRRKMAAFYEAIEGELGRRGNGVRAA